MAPLRRRQRSESVATISSGHPVHANKRPRLSTENPESDDGSGGEIDVYVHDDGYGQYTSTQNEDHIATQAQFQEYIDAPLDEEEEMRNFRRAEEQHNRDMQREADNTERLNGIILSVQCINFMCHENLSIDLGPLINFIVGHNGSGKSAVLTALTLCLGGKATSTNRGQSLKSFIKEGKENCTLIVKIKNLEPGAYRYDMYGKVITVERHFSIQGTSTFKIKNQDGKIISTKRSDLDEITDFYALQLDNPVNVLTQDMARQFLNSSTPHDKYQFFIKGVQLEQLHNDYLLIYDELKRIAVDNVNVDEGWKAAQKKAADDRRKVEGLTKIEKMKATQAKFARQHAWAQVEEVEADVNKRREAVDAAERAVVEKKTEADEKSSIYGQRDQDYEEAEAAHQTIQDRLEPLTENVQAAKKVFEETKSEMLKIQLDQREIKSMVDQQARTIRKQEALIAEESGRLERLNGGDNASFVKAVSDAEAEHESARNGLDAHPAAELPLLTAERSADMRVRDVKSALDRKKDEVREADSRLKELSQNIERDPFRAYHHSLRNLVQAIERESGFREKPIGPLGMSIKLEDAHAKWSPILEAYFGGLLNGFVVTSKSDERILSDLMKRFGYHGSVMIGSSHYIDTSSHEPASQFLTISRVLTVDNDLVRNQLIINNSMEKVALISARTAALDALAQGVNNVKAILCFEDNSPDRGYMLAGTSANKKMDPIGNRNGRGQPGARITTNKAAQIEIQNTVLRSLKQRQGEIEADLRQATNQHNACRQAITAHRRRGTELKERSQRAASALEDANNALEQATNEVSPLEAYKEDLQKAREEKEQQEIHFSASREALRELGVQNAANKKALEDVQAELENLNAEIARSNRAIGKLKDKREKALRQKNEAYEAVGTAEKLKSHNEDELKTWETHLKEYLRQASEISARVPVTLDAESLDARIDELKKQIKRAENEAGGTTDELRMKSIESETTFKAVSRERQNLKQLEALLRLSIHDRSTRWKKFRSEIVARAKIQFGYLLSERAFKGRLDFQHVEKLLILRVEPDIQIQNKHGGRETQTLSGGEKSFSTICLLLALWDAMGSPIRCLDEFDVFMDSVNRDVSMVMMIAAARRSIGRQFILITPQNMGEVARNKGSDVKIIMMHEPERGQTALHFGTN